MFKRLLFLMVSLGALSAYAQTDNSLLDVSHAYLIIKNGAVSYNADTGSWPASNNVAAFMENDGTAKWDGPYIKEWPDKNPWGGFYFWKNDKAGIFVEKSFGERYIVVSSVPAGAANKFDAKVDNGNPSTGSVRYKDGNLLLEVSDDAY